MKTVNFLVADDHEIVREGTRLLIEGEPNWHVCALASNGREAVATAEKLQPDVAVIDMMMPELNGLEALRQLKRRAPKCELLLFTASQSDQVIRDAFEAGAKSVITKAEASVHLLAALKSLVDHKPYFSSRASEILFARLLERKAGDESGGTDHQLTARERETLQLLAEGKTNKEVASVLGISVKTAETHRAAIMRKLKLPSFSDLVRYAVRHNIIEL